MASESDASVSALISRLIAMPLFAAFTTTAPDQNPNHESDHPDHESTNHQSIEQIILINPLTQGMTVIGGSFRGFDSLLNDLTMKEGPAPASEASIDGMPVTEVKSRDEIDSLGSECVICLEEWRIGDLVKEMPCKHTFHGGCVERWLRIHGCCPLCRHKMPADDLEKKIGGESERRGRRRAIWVTFTFGDGRSTTEERNSSVESHESSVESHESSVGSHES